MITSSLKKLYSRDLNKLKDEILLYRNQENIWRIDHQISNSAGNLCLHLIGNLQTYIGAEFGQTGYVRNRPVEFSLKNVPREELIAQIEKTIVVVDNALNSITAEQLEGDYPQPVLDGKLTTEYFLIHLAMHLSYHLGQVNYHRRMLDS